MAVYPSTGMWYECSIEKRLSLDEAEKFASTDMRSAQVRYRVKFIPFDHSQVVPLDYIRIRQDMIAQNEK